MIKTDREIVFALIGGNKNLDFEKLQKLTPSPNISFAKETAFKNIFKGFNPGAIPPFESLWQINYTGAEPRCIPSASLSLRERKSLLILGYIAIRRCGKPLRADIHPQGKPRGILPD